MTTTGDAWGDIWIFFCVGVAILIIGVIMGIKESKTEPFSRAEILYKIGCTVCIIVGVFFIGASGHYSGAGNPETSLLPENQPFVLKAITEGEQDNFVLVVPFARQEQTPIYYKIFKETMSEKITVDSVIIRMENRILNVTYHYHNFSKF